jgi:hypothetical protein
VLAVVAGTVRIALVGLAGELGGEHELAVGAGGLILKAVDSGIIWQAVQSWATDSRDSEVAAVSLIAINFVDASTHDYSNRVLAKTLFSPSRSGRSNTANKSGRTKPCSLAIRFRSSDRT